MNLNIHNIQTHSIARTNMFNQDMELPAKAVWFSGIIIPNAGVV